DFGLHGHGVALDQFGHFSADHMGAEEFAGLGVEHDFDEPLIFAQRNRLAVADEGELADADFAPRGLGVGFRQSHARDLGMRIGAAGNALLDHRLGALAGDAFDADNSLVAGLVRQPWRAGDVADGVEAGDIGAPVSVGEDVALFDFAAQGFEAEVLDIAGDADGDDGVRGGQGFGLGPNCDLRFDAV